MVIDTTRSPARLWVMGGVTSCGASCADLAYGGSYTYYDLWYYNLNATPTSNTWALQCGTVEPPNGDGQTDFCPGASTWYPATHGALAFDPTRDILFAFGAGSSSFWVTAVFCPGAGSPSSPQSTAGCTTKQQWYKLTPTNEPTSTLEGYYVQWPNPFYDANLDRMVSFNSGGWGLRRIFLYNSQTKTFTEPSMTGMPSESTEAASSEWNIAQILDGPYDGLYIYQKTSHLDGSPSTATYVIDLNFNVVSLMTDTGDGPGTISYITWHRAARKIVARQQSPGTIWLASLQ
jgi:hypothetical protein